MKTTATIYTKQTQQAYEEYVEREKIEVIRPYYKIYTEIFAAVIKECEGVNGTYYVVGKLYHIVGQTFVFFVDGCHTFKTRQEAYETLIKNYPSQ